MQKQNKNERKSTESALFLYDQNRLNFLKLYLRFGKYYLNL